MKNKIGPFYSRTVFIFWLAAILLVISVVAFADGDTRLTTQNEKIFIKSSLDTFAKALPPGPEGWEQTIVPGMTDLNKVPAIANQPIQLDYHITWQDSKKIQAASAKFNEELVKVAKKPGFTANELEELQKKMEPHDVKVRIDIYANISSQGIYAKIAPAPAIAGGLVYRSQGEYRSGLWYEGSTYVFLGRHWKQGTASSSSTYINFTPERKTNSTAVIQNIFMMIKADPARTQKIVEKIDWEAMKKMMEKN